jgi:glycerol-3-phosphate O-acyltransferase 3/4
MALMMDTLILLVILASGLALCSIFPNPSTRQKIEGATYKMSGTFFLLSWSGMVEYHGEPPKNDGIVIANHTSIIDVILLLANAPYALIGQQHGGFLGWLQKTMSKGNGHIWFERSESRDRKIVAMRLKAHTQNKYCNPVLVFPEGTCVNNEYVLMFRKGVFELDLPVYPVAIKYNKYFAECFWYVLYIYIWFIKLFYREISDILGIQGSILSDHIYLI